VALAKISLSTKKLKMILKQLFSMAVWKNKTLAAVFETD
jgi:hypothetical protein